MKESWITKPEKDLLKAIGLLKNSNERAKFLRDLLTEPEIKEFSSRFLAARMLDAKNPYTQIEKVTGLSSATVARIAKWLKKGKGGYKLAIHRMLGK